MGEEARRHDFDVKRELYLYHAPEHDAYIYVVESSLDISTKYPGTEVYFSARDGHLIGFEAPTGLRAGNTISSWLVALHFAAVGGLWYRCFVVCLGLLVVVLSVTGAVDLVEKARSSPARPSPRGHACRGSAQVNRKIGECHAGSCGAQRT